MAYKPAKFSKMKEETYSRLFMELAPLLDALSHPARLQILLHLSRFKSCPAGNISHRLPLCKSTVSQHMARLKETGLISGIPAGTSLQYHLNLGKVNQMKQQFLQFIDLISNEGEQKSDCSPLLTGKYEFLPDK